MKSYLQWYFLHLLHILHRHLSHFRPHLHLSLYYLSTYYSVKIKSFIASIAIASKNLEIVN